MSDDGLRESWKGPKPSEEELEQECRELKKAGWEHVDEVVGKRLWRKPDSGHIYPQDAAVTIVRGENLGEKEGESL